MTIRHYPLHRPRLGPMHITLPGAYARAFADAYAARAKVRRQAEEKAEQRKDAASNLLLGASAGIFITALTLWLLS